VQAVATETHATTAQIALAWLLVQVQRLNHVPISAGDRHDDANTAYVDR
jgi:aryl-alcohol dehydrogenase-like predicted oxidoreductase